jgi:geranylgeranyl reductase family protein
VNRPSSDVLIVGGGPAGLLAGLRLASAGRRVTLFEEHVEIGLPVHCTGVLAAEAFRAFGISEDTILNELTTVRFFSPSGDTFEYSPPRVEAVVIDRARFDQELADRAESAGVSLQRTRVTGVVITPDEAIVTAGDETFRGRACVLACGANYALHRKLGLGLPRMMLQSAQAELPAARCGPVEVHFGEEVAPGGFAWAVPVRRPGQPYVRVGVMCDGDAVRHFRRVLDHVGPRWGVRAEGCQPRQKILPLAPIKTTYTDRVLVLGDAAGLVKPTTGGGIYYSLVSAQLAAETLAVALDADDLSASMLSAYETAWRRQLGSELRWQLILRRVAQRLTDKDIDALFDLAGTDGIIPLIRRTARFNRHREFIIALLKHPPARRVLFKAALA